MLKIHLPIKSLALISLLAVFALSCKKDKDKDYLFKTGDTENMTIVMVNQTLGVDPMVPQGTISFNVEGNASTSDDFTLRNSTETLTYPDTMEFRNLRIEEHADGSLFDIAVQPSGGFAFQRIYEEFDYYGTFPRITEHHELSETGGAGFVENDYQYDYPQIRFFGAGIEIKNGDLLWDEETYYYGLTTTAGASAYYNFSMNGDSLYGQQKTWPTYAHSPVSNGPSYIVFRKNIGTDPQYGWIKVEINNTNEIYVHSVGLTN